MRYIKKQPSLLGYLFGVSLLLSLGACKKIPEPITEPGQVMFYLQGTLANKSFTFEAGKDSFFMFTQTQVDSLGLMVFEGTMAKNCSNCLEGINLSINNYKLGELNINKDSAFALGVYEFEGSSSNLRKYEVNFKQESSGEGIASYAWGFGDGTFSGNANPTKVYTQAGKYVINYVVVYSNGCKADLSYPILLKNNLVSLPNLTLTEQYTDTFTAKFVSNGGADGYLWSFGDSSFSAGKDSFAVHTYSQAGRYTVCVQQVWGVDTLTRCKQTINGNVSTCKASFSQDVKVIDSSLSAFSKVSLRYTQADGKVFESNQVVQEPTAYFWVTQSEDYLPNAHGKPTRSLRIKAACTLRNGNTLLPIMLEGVIALGAIE